MENEPSPDAKRWRDWEEDGFFLIREFVDSTLTSGMLERVIEIARNHSAKQTQGRAVVLPETNLADSVPREALPEHRVSKIFRLHRDPVFHEFITSATVARLLTPLLGPAVDCFLSQFIFKNPGAWGQPWHQDEFYFPFDHSPEVGLWLAVTESTLENGCLFVVPGSHREPVHQHIPDRRPSSNFGYFEIVDHDMSAAVPVLMKPGDLLVFHSRLMHQSRDNLSNQLRAAMVYHFAPHGTVDKSVDSPVHDWLQIMPPESEAQ